LQGLSEVEKLLQSIVALGDISDISDTSASRSAGAAAAGSASVPRLQLDTREQAWAQDAPSLLSLISESVQQVSTTAAAITGGTGGGSSPKLPPIPSGAASSPDATVAGGVGSAKNIFVSVPSEADPRVRFKPASASSTLSASMAVLQHLGRALLASTNAQALSPSHGTPSRGVPGAHHGSGTPSGVRVDPHGAQALGSLVEALDTNMASLLSRRGKRLSEMSTASGGSVRRGSGGVEATAASDAAAMGEAFESYTHIFDQRTQEAVMGYVSSRPRLLTAKERMQKAVRRLGRVALLTRALTMGAREKAAARADQLNGALRRASVSGGEKNKVKGSSRGAFRGGTGMLQSSVFADGTAEATAAEGLDAWTYDIFAKNKVLSSKYGEVPSGESIVPAGTKNSDGTLEYFAADGHLFGNRMLTTALTASLHNLSVFRDLPVEQSTVVAWCSKLGGGYRASNPYHNALHAADVTHGIYFLLSAKEGAGGLAAGASLRPETLLACVLAAAGHDVGHLGTNNPYLIATSDPIALRYNDASPLENMHAATMFELMKADGAKLDVLAPLDTPVRLAVRSFIIRMILATDNSRHFDFKANLDKRLAGMEDYVKVFGVPGSDVSRERAASGLDGTGAPLPHPDDMEFAPLQWNPPLPEDIKTKAQGAGRQDGSHDHVTPYSTPDDLVLLMCNVLHAADISNPARPKHLYDAWTDRVLEEFHRQGEAEVDKDLPVGPLNDRSSPIPRCKMQAGFIRALVLPLYSAINRLPELSISNTAMATLSENLGEWEAEIAALSAAS